MTSTQAPDGTVNLAPFSYFNTVGHDPPTLAVSICRNGDGTKKDTLNNIEANGYVAKRTTCTNTNPTRFPASKCQIFRGLAVVSFWNLKKRRRVWHQEGGDPYSQASRCCDCSSCWSVRPVQSHVCREFVVAIMSDWFVESANHTCGNFPPEVDEMAVSGLTPVPSVHVAPPRLRESAVSMECKVRIALRRWCEEPVSCS